MSPEPKSVIEQAQQAERTRALRHLLRSPLVLQHEDIFPVIVRHRSWLVLWFADNPGWTLIVDPPAGFARLHKIPARLDCYRPLQRSGKLPFNQRRYVLLFLTLAALEETQVQTTLAKVAELVEGVSRHEPTIEPFDPNRHSERRAFVDVLRWLMDIRVLGLRDGDTEAYARSREGNALYDVNERLLGQIIAAPLPPALAGSPEHLLDELVYADTEEGQRLRARHAAIRLVLDHPLIYYDDLAPAVYAWLHQSRGFVYRLLQDDLGFEVERRKEGLAAVDPKGEVSDIVFPDGESTMKHAALLLAEKLADYVRGGHSGPVETAVLVSWTESLIGDFGERCYWSKEYMNSAGGAALLAGDALELLAAFGLVADAEGAWQPRPAIQWFAPEAPTRRT